jgi:hypothetical protein
MGLDPASGDENTSGIFLLPVAPAGQIVLFLFYNPVNLSHGFQFWL